MKYPCFIASRFLFAECDRTILEPLSNHFRKMRRKTANADWTLYIGYCRLERVASAVLCYLSIFYFYLFTKKFAYVKFL